MNITLELFLVFARIGLFTFGGGYGAIPLIRDVVLSYGWIEEERLTYMIAVSESTPGPIMVNMATYIGSSQAGFWGALIATIAVVLPSLVITVVIMSLLEKGMKNPFLQAILQGLKPCIIGIILATGAYMILRNCAGSFSQIAVDPKAVIMTLILGIVYFGSREVLEKGLSPVGLIGISAAAGIIVYGLT